MANSSGQAGETMNRAPFIAGTAIVLLAVSISLLVVMLPGREQSEGQSSSRSGRRDFFTIPEKPRTNDGETFKPDWN